MVFFARVDTSALYVATAVGDPGWLGYVLPPAATAPGPDLDLAGALTDPALGGTFVFAADAPALAAPGAVAAFVTAIGGVLAPSPASRAVVWLTDVSDIRPGTAPLLGLGASGGSVVSQLQAPVVATALFLSLASGAALALDGTDLVATANGVVTFAGSAAPATTQVQEARLPFAGARRGSIAFDVCIRRDSLYGRLNWGFQFARPAPADPVFPAHGEWLPLAAPDVPSSGDLVGFAALVNPADPLGTRLPAATALVFTGRNYDGSATVLASGYRTTYGETVLLAPVPGPLDADPSAARLGFATGVLTASGGQQFQAAPVGNFVLVVPGVRDGGTRELACGLSGTEFVTVRPAGETGDGTGDRLRFTARCPAYAARYPFAPVSPVGVPYDPDAPVLDATYVTSWASVVRAAGVPGTPNYVAQPVGAPLYGRDALVHAAHPALLGPVDPGVVLPETTTFPLAPYALTTPHGSAAGFGAAEVEDFERQVVGPTRRSAIGQGGGPAAARRVAGDAAAPSRTATPAGLLVDLDATGRWTKVLLAQQVSPALRQICFCRPDGALQQALQTADLFLVAANHVHLGRLAGAGTGDCGDDAAFFGQVNIGDWEFAVNTGAANRYGDYRDVLIVKGRKGALYDPADPAGSQVANPDRWTQARELAAPSTLVDNPNPPPAQMPGPPDPAQLVTLSSWLCAYFAAAAAQPDEYFAAFNLLARDPDWTGILVLRATIAGLPPDLAGMLAGIAAPDRFDVHHLGFEISQVTNAPDLPDIGVAGTTSMFGLIDYVDPTVTVVAGHPPAPVPPLSTGDYDFRVLSLKVRFANSAVQAFESYAQVCLRRLFGMPVTSMAGPATNPFDAIVLQGSYQDNGGSPSYALASTDDVTFLVPGGVVRTIEVTGAQMTTRSAGSQPGQDVVSWIGLTGFLDFGVLAAKDGTPFDVFSFGGPAEPSEPRQGLSFADLGLRLSYPLGAPDQRSLTFDPGELRFDLATSTPRDGSLFRQFALDRPQLVHGDATSPPSAAGYLAVVPDAPLTGVDGGEWYGISYRLDLGTPGALAGHAGLTSSLLTAWACSGGPGGGPAASLGVELPGTAGGAPLISLQTVLALSIGQVRLVRAGESFLLMLTDVALKVLGLLRVPPSGSTLFYLFGNPQGAAAPSGLGWYALYRQAPPPAPALTR